MPRPQKDAGPSELLSSRDRVVREPAKSSVTIGALDLKRVNVPEMVQARANELRAAREELAQKSKQRISNWDSTIAGQRRLRLKARQDHLEGLEAERRRLDALYAAENEERKQQILQRAEKLLYAEKDEGKTFHSKVLLFQVLQERDQQVAMRKSHVDFFKIYDDSYIKSMRERATREQIEQLRVQEQRLRAKHQTKEELEKAIARNAQARVLSREEKLAEGKEVRKIDAQYLAGRAAVQAQETDKQRQRMHELRDMIQAVQEKRQREIREERQHDEKIKQWAARKERQTEIKQAMEHAFIEEAIRVRERLALTQKMQEDNRDAETNARIERAIQLKEDEARRQRAEAQRKRERIAQEMTLYFNQSQERTARQKAESKEQGRIRLQNAIAEAAAAAQDEAAAKDERMQTAKALAETNLELGAQARERREQTRRENRAAKLDMAADDDAKEEKLIAYMRRIAAEPWAAENWRLKNYVDAYASRHATKQAPAVRGAIVSGSLGASKDRVGMAGSYDPLDFASTQNIARLAH